MRNAILLILFLALFAAPSAAAGSAVGKKVAWSPARSVQYWTPARRAAATPLHRGPARASWLAAPPGITSPEGRGVPTIGILYVLDQQYRRWSCSAASVFSQGQSLIWTAGHCVHNEGAFMISGSFVPGANNSTESPLGIWGLTQFNTTGTWAQHSSCT